MISLNILKKSNKSGLEFFTGVPIQIITTFALVKYFFSVVANIFFLFFLSNLDPPSSIKGILRLFILSIFFLSLSYKTTLFFLFAKSIPKGKPMCPAPPTIAISAFIYLF